MYILIYKVSCGIILRTAYRCGVVIRGCKLMMMMMDNFSLLALIAAGGEKIDRWIDTKKRGGFQGSGGLNLGDVLV